MHVSDCSIWGEKGCDCGDLDLTVYPAHCYVILPIPVARRFGLFVDHMGRHCFVEPEQLPADTLIAIAAASDLPDARDFVAVFGDADSVDLNNSREAIISKFEALLRPECVTP